MSVEINVEAKLADIYRKIQMEFNDETEESKVEPVNMIIDINALSLSDIGFNSISLIKLIVEIENEFNFEFEDKMLDMGAYNSARDLSNYVKSRVNEITV